VIGSLLLILAMFEGYFGYSLPDDLLSGIGLRAALSSITMGIPVIGTWLHWALFGGDFPAAARIHARRSSPAHVRAAHPADPGNHPGAHRCHLAMVWFQKHTQFPGPVAPRRTSSACGSCRCSPSSPARSSR
jgi:ubiquinol-cytochrome c reductase cytochrome b subunit